MARSVLVSALVALAVVLPGEAAQITPVQKVIQMMQEMRAKGDEEMKAEEVTFTTFAGWCENTAKARTEAIAKGTASMERLAAEIEKLTADAATLGREIEEQNAVIDEKSAEKKTATAQRAEAQEIYNKEDAEYSSMIGELHSGAAQVNKMMDSSPGASASFLQKMASRPTLPSGARRVLASFLESSNEFKEAAPEAHEFQSQSGGIADMMAGLEDKFADEKQNNWRAEMEAVHKFQLMEQTLTDQIEMATQISASKTSAKKETEAAAAAAKQELSETTVVRDDDSKYLADLKSTCASKTKDFEARQKLRGEELTAIDEAVDILSSGAVSGAASKHLPAALAQVRGGAAAMAQLRSSVTQPTQTAAAAFLKMQGARLHSTTLIAISARVSEDPFKKVSKMIKDMIFKLQTEATEESEHKGFCDTELATNKQSRDKLSSEVDDLTAEIEGLTAKSNKLASDCSALTADIAELDSAMAEATTIRAAEKEKNAATIADAQVAIAAVTQATSVLKDFYAKAAGATALSQVERGVGDDMPATFDKPYTGMAGGGVMGMLEVVLSDFQRLEAETTETEAASAAEYTKFMDDSRLSSEVKKTEVQGKTDLRTRTDSQASTAKTDLESSNEQLTAAMKYYDELKPSCVDAGLDYDERTARRNEEVESLKEALKILTP